ncbi:MAG: CvpA family protein [Lactobacillales bacterium]|jgi:membrane protein required for colicin V production|nr:CvpA family protein [Lactobacillales bacterium]
MSFGIIDIIVLVLLILSIIFAFYRGLVRELLGITAWILAGFGALYTYTFIQPYMNKLVGNETLSGIISAALIALIILVIMTLINAKITGKLRKSALSGLDRLLGFAFGIFRAVLLVVVVYIMASFIFPEKKFEAWNKENVSMPYIEKMAKFVQKGLPDSIKNNLKTQAEEPKKKIGKTVTKNIKKEVVEYQEKERKSLDEIFEKVMEGE